MNNKKLNDEIFNKSNEIFNNMTGEDFNKLNKLMSEIKYYLAEAMKHFDSKGEAAMKVAQLHKEYIEKFWGNYTEELQANIAQAYVDDERFTKNFDDKAKDTAKFFRDIIFEYLKIDKENRQ